MNRLSGKVALITGGNAGIGESIAKLFADAGFIVIVSLISPTIKDRQAARHIIGDGFREVHVHADLATCRARDPKKLYARAAAGEIAPVVIRERKAERVVEQDQGPREDSTLEALGKLAPLTEGGTHTAGNSPGVTDGAAMLVAMSEEQAAARGALEQHVLVQVGEPRLLLPLVRAAHLHPGLHGHHAGGALGLEDDGEAVGELEGGGHGGGAAKPYCQRPDSRREGRRQGRGERLGFRCHVPLPRCGGGGG